jgi:glycosyltransferase involved in cell wall biosynthesis
MNDATLSVLMPVWNGGAFLARALESALRAKCVNEIVVVDDGSDDGSASIAASFGSPVHCFTQKRRGPAAARNFALDHARGEIIAFLDADDWWNDGHPDRALEILLGRGALVVSARTQCVICARDGNCEPAGLPFESLQLGSLICRRGVFTRAGKFDPALRDGEDLDWFLRVRDAGCVIQSIDAIGLYYRLHSRNQANVYRNSRTGLLAALHRATERRRRASLLTAAHR